VDVKFIEPRRDVWRPAAEAAGVSGVTFHGLRHCFVAILVAAGCNIREVSEWAGHNSVAFTLTRYGGLFEDGSDAAVDRLDALLGDGASAKVVELKPAQRWFSKTDGDY
jgi:integrase